MNCETCGEKLVRLASGYGCPNMHGRILSAEFVERADAVESRLRPNGQEVYRH